MTRAEVGVIGGVGPAATAEFLARVVAWTDAESDQEHADLVVLQHSSIPDRTDFLLGRSEDDPGPVFASDARRLQQMGVGGIVVPCNTAHAFMRAMVEAVDIPVVDIVACAAEDAASRGLGAVGVLATAGTVASGTYHEAIGERGLRPIFPRAEAQEAVTALIYEDVKAGRPPRRGLLDTAISDVVDQGAEGILLGCTELSVAAAEWEVGALVIDALDSLAVRTVELAGCRVRGSSP